MADPVEKLIEEAESYLRGIPANERTLADAFITRSVTALIHQRAALERIRDIPVHTPAIFISEIAHQALTRE